MSLNSINWLECNDIPLRLQLISVLCRSVLVSEVLGVSALQTLSSVSASVPSHLYGPR